MASPTGKGSGRKGGGGRPPARRTPPTAATGLEAKFLEGTVSSGVPLVLVMSDGAEIRGVVVEFDRDQLILEGDNGTVVVRKSEIRYLYEDPNQDGVRSSI
jgi:hypothetical protein